MSRSVLDFCFGGPREGDLHLTHRGEVQVAIGYKNKYYKSVYYISSVLEESIGGGAPAADLNA